MVFQIINKNKNIIKFNKHKHRYSGTMSKKKETKQKIVKDNYKLKLNKNSKRV
jgi:hypothetical protein